MTCTRLGSIVLIGLLARGITLGDAFIAQGVLPRGSGDRHRCRSDTSRGVYKSATHQLLQQLDPLAGCRMT